MPGSFLKNQLKRFGYEIRNLKSTANADPSYALRRLLRGPVSIIFDVGANKGEVTASYHALFPAASIYAFEPFPAVFSQLQSRFRAVDNIHVFPLALADECRKKTLKLSSSDLLSSFLDIEKESWLGTLDGFQADRLGQNVDSAKTVEVDCTTLDAFCQEKQLSHIDLLKIDVQGAELQVIAGAQRLLSTNAIDVIYCEANFAPQYKGQAFFRDVDQSMSEFRYRLFGLYELTSGGDGSIGFGNAIFISDRFHKQISSAGHYWKPL